MKAYKLRFKTADKSSEDVKKEYDFSPPPVEMCEKIAEAYRNLDGLVVVGAAWEYSPESYSVYSWEDDADEKLKEFIYLAEQDEFFGSYINERDQFELDWKNEEYEPSTALHFNKSDLEVIERLLSA